MLTGWVSDFNGGARPGEALAVLRRLHKAEIPFAVITEDGVYPEMLIRRYEFPRFARGVRFTLELEEVQRVGVTDSELPAASLAGPAVGRSGEVDRGRVALPPVT